jgi:TonB family protein
MWAPLEKKICSTLCSPRRTSRSGPIAALLVAMLASLYFDATAAPQDSVPTLPGSVQTEPDALGSRLAEHIRDLKIDSSLPKVLVIDFPNTGDKQFSKLGTILADGVAQSLANSAIGFQVQDRKLFAAYLKENWMGLDDLQSEGVCLTLARSRGGAGVVRGTLEAEANQQLRISLQLEGIGPAWSGDVQFPLTDALRKLMKQPAATYARSPDVIPTEPGVFRPGEDGVTLPASEFCPSPDYTDLAREAKYRGTVELSLIVTKEGDVNSVMVLRGAPFSLTQQAIDTVQKWKFKPAKKNKQSVSVRVPVDIEFQLY